MGKITTTLELKASILELEQKQAGQWLLLKEEAGIVYENLKPINLIKNTLQELSSAEGLANNLVNSFAGVVTGLLTKKIVVGNSNNLFRNIFGGLVQAAVTNIIIRHPEMLKSMASRLIDRFFGKKDTNQAEPT